ncbi:patatin-like phospholipase family protein [Brevibacillus fulvus]|uniref:NTE family protein n=1 Tax=Brevibacillus fulvus TaxID=1125967 RepID=A0A939BSI4_9BACL|nr:patatin-like phospholipase family protein [Brevibacillus fulvus]MBM7588559.1 NTE family protein [Brevibacillus fulvus]
MKADAVFEGGGVKGIAFIGALSEMEAKGYRWERLAGTSAGSIVAALLAAGYHSKELLEVFQTFNYIALLERTGMGKLKFVGPLYNLLVHEGMYSSNALERFVGELLKKKGIVTFADLPPDKLKIIASDLTAGRMIVFPDDLPSFGINPASFPISRAVQMSSSIPYFFQPFLLKNGKERHYIVDGAVLSNFPVWLFDVREIPRWPTFGFRLRGPQADLTTTRIRSVFSLTKALFTTMLEAHDRLYVEKAHAVRTIFIPTLDVKTTDFDLAEEKRALLFEAGKTAAKKFLETWNFDKYIEEFRKQEPEDAKKAPLIR